MPKNETGLQFETDAEYKVVLDRILAITATRTQVALAQALGVRQSSISDSKRRKSIPANWLLTLLTQFNTNPKWIETGEGAQTLVSGEKRGEMLVVDNYVAIAKAPTDELLTELLERADVDNKVLLSLYQERACPDGMAMTFSFVPTEVAHA
ncbi:MAG: helix-turn-helix domain-containing protein [Desulfovibrio sp.]